MQNNIEKCRRSLEDVVDACSFVLCSTIPLLLYSLVCVCVCSLLTLSTIHYTVPWLLLLLVIQQIVQITIIPPIIVHAATGGWSQPCHFSQLLLLLRRCRCKAHLFKEIVFLVGWRCCGPFGRLWCCCCCTTNRRGLLFGFGRGRGQRRLLLLERILHAHFFHIQSFRSRR